MSNDPDFAGQVVYKPQVLSVSWGARINYGIHCMRPTLIESGNWFLLHINALAHISLCVHSFLSENEVVSLNHLPYSPDLVPADYFLFPKLKITMKGNTFQSIPSIQWEVTRQLNAIPEKASKKAFQRLITPSKD